jgi:hypothetical protein
MSQWVRLWDDMPTDPKWRVVARRSGRQLPEVLAVFVFMMTNAGANATERGRMTNWSDEDVGAALDMDAEHVTSIREAMQGKTLDGDKLSGWDRRQPKREDNSSERARAWREEQNRKREEEKENERARTQPNAEKHPDADADADAEPEELNTKITDNSLGGLVASPTAPRKAKRAKARSQIDENAQPDEKDHVTAAEHGLSAELFRSEWRKFRDHHLAHGSLFSDWHAAWRKWCGNIPQFQQSNARAGPVRGGNGFAALAVNLARNEREQHQQTGRNFEAVPMLSGGVEEPRPGAGGDDDHGLRGNSFDLLVGNGFRRM